MNNQKTFFTADIHLSIGNRRKTGMFESFIDMVIEQRGHLFILGDMFDFWANNSIVVNNNLSVLKKISQISLKGLKAGFVFGNRDYLINAKTLSRFGISHLGEETELELCNKSVLITHGHTLCLSDEKFIRYKKNIWPLIRLLDRVLPGPVENLIARMMIKKSKQTIKSQSPSTFEFTTPEIDRRFANGTDVVICGHRHRKEVYQNRDKRFYALPAWKDNAGHYLLHEGGEFCFHEFRCPSAIVRQE